MMLCCCIFYCYHVIMTTVPYFLVYLTECEDGLIQSLEKADSNVSQLGLHFLGCGQYNICYDFEFAAKKYVLKVRRYNPEVINNIASLLGICNRLYTLLPHLSYESLLDQMSPLMRFCVLLMLRDKTFVAYKFGLLARQLIQERITPHLSTVLTAANIKNVYTNVLQTDLIPQKRRCDLNKLKEVGSPLADIYNQVHIEPFYDGGDLRSHIVANVKKVGDEFLRSVIFQVVYTLYAIQTLFPSFRHNDLSPANVFLSFLRPEASEPISALYTVANRKYFLQWPSETQPYCAVADYDFTSVCNHKALQNFEVGHTWLSAPPYHIGIQENKSYDVRFFLTCLLKVMRETKVAAPLTTAFIEATIAAAGEAAGGVARDVKEQSSMFPQNVLNSPYFSPLVVPYPPNKPHLIEFSIRGPGRVSLPVPYHTMKIG